MAIQQISVFLENRPGTLNELTAILAGAGINLRALTIAEEQEFGIARMLVNDTDAALALLKEEGYICRLTPVLAYAIPDEAGGLNSLLKVFTEAAINIKYMYSSVVESGRAYMVMNVSRFEESEAALAAAGLAGVTEEELK